MSTILYIIYIYIIYKIVAGLRVDQSGTHSPAPPGTRGQLVISATFGYSLPSHNIRVGCNMSEHLSK